MNKRIFILEDELSRMDWFNQTFADCEIVTSSNVEDALNKLRSGNFDLIFLDRDLGHPQQSGENVAWAMMQESLCPDATVVVHSLNTYGQKVISRYISSYNSDVQVIPFTSLSGMTREDFGFN